MKLRFQLYLSFILLVIVIIVILFSYCSSLPHLLSSVYGTQTSYSNDDCIIESKMYHRDYVIVPNRILELDDISAGTYSVKGTEYQLNISPHYFFKCYPQEYLIASAYISTLNSIELRRLQNSELGIVVMGNYTLEEIRIGDLSFHKRDIDYLNNTLILIRRGFVIIPLHNSTLARSLIKKGAYIRMGLEKGAVDLVIYPLERNRENIMSTNYGTSESSKAQINGSPSEWNEGSQSRTMPTTSQGSLNRSILYAIILIVSLIILLYYLMTVRKLG